MPESIGKIQRSRRGLTATSVGTLGLAALTLITFSARAQQTSQTQPPAKAFAKTTSPTPDGKAFASPEAAVEALHAAAKQNDESQLMAILGPGARDMVLWDDNATDRQDQRAEFARNYEQMHRLVGEPNGTVNLYVGSDNWPLPIPLVRISGAWYFDAPEGKREVMFRRIGQNELEALEVCHALVEAEKDYYGTAHAYTLRFTSTSGTHDGLYWTGSSGQSPIGPYLAHAGLDAGGGSPVSYHGYYYRILAAPSGGFAILAFPAEYRSSGVMAFLMDQNGTAYEKDLGPMTDAIAKQMSSPTTDSTWKKSE